MAMTMTPSTMTKMTMTPEAELAAIAIGGQSVTPRALSWQTPALAASLRAAVAVLRSAKTAVVISHHNPDGDAIGSTLGVVAVLDAMGITAYPVNRDRAPEEFAFLPGSERLASAPPQRPDVTVLLDCSVRERTGLEHSAEVWGAQVICLDHHRTAAGSDLDVFVHDDRAAATAELVYRLAVAAEVSLTPALATCLFAALHTDTGSFRYSVTSARTMELASCLLEGGIDTWEVASRIFEQQRVERLRLSAVALRSLHVSPDGRLAAIHVTDAMIKEAGAAIADADGLVNFARSLRGVEVAVQLTQDGADAWRASFRSRGAVDVSALAARLGGGGHRNAAGARLQGSVEEVQRSLDEALVAMLDGAAEV